MKKFGIKLAMPALLLVLGFAVSVTFVSCDNGSTSSGSGAGDITLSSGYSSSSVDFLRPEGLTSSSVGDYTLTINGTNINISRVDRMAYRIVLDFPNSAFPLTKGSRYTVTVAYTGSMVSPFTYSETVTCK